MFCGGIQDCLNFFWDHLNPVSNQRPLNLIFSHGREVKSNRRPSQMNRVVKFMLFMVKKFVMNKEV